MTAPLTCRDSLVEAGHDVVVIGGSAGGIPALRALVSSLPQDFPLPVVAMLHLSLEAEAESVLQRLPLRVARLTQGQSVTPGTVWLCPPRCFVELLPDGTCVVTDNPRGALALPIDKLLVSTARSFGPLAMGVILTGMGSDGALGARELHGAGGRVLVQAPGTAEHGDMPSAAIALGAADLVVPLVNLGEIVADFALGAPRQKARSELRALATAFGDSSEVAMAAQEVDWQRTSLGIALAWPEQLKSAVRETVDSPFPSAVWWGSEHAEIFNDAWATFLGARQADALGKSARWNWAATWERFDGLLAQVRRDGVGAYGQEETLLVQRGGFLEEAHVRFAFAPLRDAAGEVVGLRCTLWESTAEVVAQRRARLLRAVGREMAGAVNRHDACAHGIRALADFSAEVPFALVYLLDLAGQQASLAGAVGLEIGSTAAPRVLHLADGSASSWPLARVLQASASGPCAPFLVDRLDERFPDFATRGARAVLVPMHGTPSGAAQGILVIGLEAHRPYDDVYTRFIETFGQQLATALGDALAKELELERSDRLATLDRAKTDFFANVSHEFRTPLTLLLAPLEELAQAHESLPPRIGADLRIAVPNARRLLRLVDSLLDFSQVERRGRQALVAPADLGVSTTDIASAFRSAIEEAGLQLQVEVPRDLPPVPVDGTLWEQIVSNLLSNALKFTFQGAIGVRLKQLRLHVELEISDSGIGIPADELPHIFKRFHRVRGARARTAEGSGIGLAMVSDSVQRMGGQLTVRSTVDRGTTFTIWLPFKTARPSAEARPVPDAAAQAELAAELANEASRWSAAGLQAPADVIEDMVAPSRRPATLATGTPLNRLLIVDDNADLRAYLRRLLEGQWEVRVAANGAQGIALAREQTPDLVLADVMMPEQDGFQLLQQLRADARLERVPVILLSARATEQAAIDGLRAGADDYIAKPFSPRELAARLQGTLDRARARTALQQSEAQQRLTLELVPALLWWADAAGTSITFTEAWKVYTGQNAEQGAKPDWFEAVHPDEVAASREAFERAFETGEALERQQRIRRVDGEYRWHLVRLVPVRAENDVISRWFGAAIDIHELNELQERRRLLVTELQHRTRTLLDVVRFTANRAFDETNSSSELRKRFLARLEALGRVQGLLSRLGETDRIGFDELLASELAALNVDMPRLTLDGPKGVGLRSKTVQVLGLALHELATNAVKYGALGQSQGRLVVRWRVKQSEDDERPWLLLHWRESGVQLPASDQSSRRSGQGLESIEQALPYPLGAETLFELTPDGAHCTIHLPID